MVNLNWNACSHSLVDCIGLLSEEPLRQFTARLCGLAPTASTLLLLMEVVDAPFTTEIVVLVVIEYLASTLTLPIMTTQALSSVSTV